MEKSKEDLVKESNTERIQHLKGLVRGLLQEIAIFGATNEDNENIRDYRKEIKELETVVHSSRP